MSKINTALEFLKDDMKEARKQWTEGKAFESLLQRNGYGLDELLNDFDPADDEEEWDQEYQDKTKKRANKLKLYRKRLSFLKASRKEFHEDYDDNVTDVDFIRLLEVPYTDPQYAIDFSISEMGDE